MTEGQRRGLEIPCRGLDGRPERVKKGGARLLLGEDKLRDPGERRREQAVTCGGKKPRAGLPPRGEGPAFGAPGK